MHLCVLIGHGTNWVRRRVRPRSETQTRSESSHVTNEYVNHNCVYETARDTLVRRLRSRVKSAPEWNARLSRQLSWTSSDHVVDHIRKILSSIYKSDEHFQFSLKIK